MLDLATAVWLVGSLALLVLFYVSVTRFVRSQRTLRSEGRPAAGDPAQTGHTPDNASGRPSMVTSQSASDAERFRRRAIGALVAFGLFGLLGFPAIANASSWVERTLPRLDTASVNSGALLLLIFYLGVAGVMARQFRAAVKGGPGWRAGHDGDPIRPSRLVTMTWALSGIIVMLILAVFAASMLVR